MKTKGVKSIKTEIIKSNKKQFYIYVFHNNTALITNSIKPLFEKSKDIYSFCLFNAKSKLDLASELNISLERARDIFREIRKIKRWWKNA